MDVISITFEINAQSHRDGQFTVPKQVCDLLGLKPGEEISSLIEPMKIPTIKKLSSGTEIYGSDISNYVKAGKK